MLGPEPEKGHFMPKRQPLLPLFLCLREALPFFTLPERSRHVSTKQNPTFLAQHLHPGKRKERRDVCIHKSACHNLAGCDIQTQTLTLSSSWRCCFIKSRLKEQAVHAALPSKANIILRRSTELEWGKKYIYGGKNTRGQISQCAWSSCSCRPWDLVRVGPPETEAPGEQGSRPCPPVPQCTSGPHSSSKELLGDGPGRELLPLHTSQSCRFSPPHQGSKGNPTPETPGS